MLSRKNIWLIIILMGLTLSIFSNVYGDDWIFYGENNRGKQYYDKNSMIYPFDSKTIIRVWVKIIYDENIRNAYIQDLMDRGISMNQQREMGLDELVTMMTHLEIDCKEIKYGYIQNILYDKDGKMLYDRSYQSIQRNRSVAKGWVIENLFKKICNF